MGSQELNLQHAVDEEDVRRAVQKRDGALESQRANENRFRRLYQEFLEIEAEDAKAAGQVGFVAKWMVHATLPYTNPKGNPAAWGRRSGNVSLMIQPGYYHKPVEHIDDKGRKSIVDELVSYGYPYGSAPRLILAWLATEVARKKERNIVLGDSLAEFMAALGKHAKTGGVRGSITGLKDQMQRLFTATISVSTDPTHGNQWQTEGFRIADSANIELWWDAAQPGQSSLWRSELRLTERFFETLVTNPIPVDLRIIRSLSRSAMAMDIYSWLTYRNAILNRRIKLSWEGLMAQFGTEATKYKFRESFEKNLKDVLILYPEAKVETDVSGITLFPSPPSVARIPPAAP